MAISFNQNFLSSGSVTIPLTADINTDVMRVSGLTGQWAIQAVNLTGLDGTPTWTLEASLDGVYIDKKTWL